MKKINLILILAIGLIISMVSDIFAKSVLRIVWTASAKCGVNPFLAYNEEDYVFINHMYEPLIVGMMDGSLKPWLVKSWAFDQKSMTWTFLFDERAKWSDGNALTAHDAKFTFETAWKYNFPL